ncbi:hypothetical protein CHL78_002160 [Romboutsia weinsteinii]|uniref:histidine kinase n=1 Tax=Romboutsia weinsteinii TaxID=2020949 RepID=A0A371J8N1_9FIRM|nr:histidine kinase [Romboutsia weinsteinii]RDY29132.1 hypothetical protein CHL78_002160 [Romboutsia weinsteinii]
MLSSIIINLILSINLFFYEIEVSQKYTTTIILISISMAIYIYSNLIKDKDIKRKVLMVNIIFIIISCSIFPKLILLLSPVIVEYILSKRYSDMIAAIGVFVAVLIQLRLNIGYLMISLGVVSSIFVYINLINNKKKEKLEKINYDLKEKLYNIEESRVLENKLNHQSIETIKIEERNSISQKLHDKIGHTLAGSIMQLEALKIIMNSDSKKGIEMLDGITDNLRNGMDDIRTTLRKIKPEQAEVRINNLKLMLEEFSKSYKIDYELSLEGDLQEISMVYWKVILDSLKEILTNTIKYSNCDKISMEISLLNKIIRVHIKDNGICNGKIKKGMGLLGIEERVINIGGDVSFNNEDGFSTLIILKR